MPVLDGSDKALGWGRRVRFQLMCSAYKDAQHNGGADDDFAIGTEVPARKVTSAWAPSKQNSAAQSSATLRIRPPTSSRPGCGKGDSPKTS